MSLSLRTACLPIAVVFALFFVPVAGMLFWGGMSVFGGSARLGDGVDPETYGFDLSNLTIDRASLQTSGNSRDFLETYQFAKTIPGVDVAGRNAARSRSWQKEVVSDDRVIGVEVNGEYRAYPLFIMNAHEIVWDELGGQSIIVTYSPLLDAACVYEPYIGANHVRFGVSGLLNNLNLLMYAGDPASLFSQFSGEAISGYWLPEKLTRIRGVTIDRWKTWLTAHSETTVILRDPGTLGRYKRISYDRYFLSDGWIIPPVGEIPGGPKDRVLGVRGEGEWMVFGLKELKDSADEEGLVERVIDGRTLRLQFDPSDHRVDTVHVVDSGGLELLPSLKIAWPLLDD